MTEFASNQLMYERRAAAEEFYRNVFGPDGDEYGDYELAFVSDEATLRDIDSASEAAVIDRIRDHYGVAIGLADFEVPFWQLLDRLQAERP